MRELTIFIAGCLFSRYILMVFDYLLEWLASYVSLRISFINQQINNLSLEQSHEDSTNAIGFVVSDTELYNDESDDYIEINKK